MDHDGEDCPFIECGACGTIDHRDRLRHVWLHVTVTLVSARGGGETLTGLVCSKRCYKLWSNALEVPVPVEKPKRGRPPKKAVA